MKNLLRCVSALFLAHTAVLPLQAAAQYEELAKKLISHIPQQDSPVRMSVVKFTLPEDKKGLGGAENIKDELEVELGRDSRIKLITRTDLEALEKEWNFQEGEMADPQTQAQQSKVAGIDVLVRGRVALRESGEVCVYAELLNVADGAISKEKVSWMPDGAQPAPQPVYQPAPQPQVQPATLPPPSSPNGGDNSDLQPLIDRMASLNCKHASSAYHQSFLLRMLPQIRDGASVDMTTSDSGGRTALHHACGIGSSDITMWLINHGADVNKQAFNGETPLDSLGVNRSGLDIWLIQHGAKHSYELGQAAPSPQAWSPPRGTRSQAELRSALASMASVKRSSGMTSMADQLEAIGNGGDVNGTYGDSNGNNALNYAAYEGDAERARMLLELGANLNICNNGGWNPIINAVFKCHTSCAQVLLEAGANPNQLTPSNSTLLMLAAMNGDTAMIRLLVSAGANINALNPNGYSALRLAESKGQMAAAALLRSLGATR
ncbi:MAG: ankyrin repeat domain-containing protein [Akkermansia sp.]|nr:ankyrin repeat domain-containing protein [Akkermansia sp.]